MRPSARLAAALWLGATGCQQCSRPTSPPPTADTIVVPSASAPSGRAVDLCGPVEAHNRAFAASAADELRQAVERGDVPADWVRDRQRMATPCLRWPASGAATSAWAIRAEREANGGVQETTWSLVHIARDGAQAALDETFTEVCCSPTSARRDVRLFDLDGDGDPEIAFSIEHEGPEGGGDVTHHLYTHKGGRVQPYPLPFAGPLRDLDGDGRPDLLLEHSDERKLPCMSFAYHDIAGPSLLAHGLPDGTFSLTDAAAAAHARKACPAPPASLVARGPGGVVDEDATARDVVCARAWGAPAAQLRAALEKGCREPDFVDDCDEARKRRPGECVHRDALLEWAERAPVVLAPAASR